MKACSLSQAKDFQVALADIAQNQETGSFTLTSNYVIKRFNVDKGCITGWFTSNKDRQIGNMGFALLQLGVVSLPALSEAFTAQHRQKKHYCQILCENGILSREDMQSAADFVVSEEICESFTWVGGNYEIIDHQFPSTSLNDSPYLQTLSFSVPLSNILANIPVYLEEWQQVTKQLNQLELVLASNKFLTPELQERIDREIIFYSGKSKYDDADKVFDSSITRRLKNDLSFINGKATLKEIVEMITADRLRFCRLVLDLLRRDYLHSLGVDELVTLAEQHKESKNWEKATKYFNLALIHPDLSPEKQSLIEKVLKTMGSSLSSEQTQMIEPNAATFRMLGPDSVPFSLPGYEILHEVGNGAMGKVYKATQKSLNRLVAIKVVPPSFSNNQMLIKRLEKEAKAMAQLKHPNIVSAIDFGFQKQYYYIVMEYVEGGKSLRHIIDEKGKLNERETAELGLAMASALKYLSENRLVHRDIKPSNILIDKDGTPKLADLGLIKDMQVDSGLTTPGTVVGTPAYMSPEQIQADKNIDIRSDIYSLGATLLHALTGKARFDDANSLGVIYCKIIYEPQTGLKQMASISEAMGHILCKMLQPDREKRYQTAEELSEELRQFLAGKLRPLPQSTTKPKWILPTAIAALVLLGCVLLWQSDFLTRLRAFTSKTPTGTKSSEPDSKSQVSTAPQPNADGGKSARELALQSIAVLYEAKQYAQLVAACSDLLQKEPKEVEAYYWRGQGWLRLHKWEESATDLQRYTVMKPEAAQGWLWKGYVSYLQQQFPKALEELAHAQKLQDNCGEASYVRARIYYASGKQAEAQQELQKVLEITPTSWEANYLRSVVVSEKNPALALEYLQQSLTPALELVSPPGPAWLGYYHGILLEKARRALDAKQAYENALAQTPAREIAARLAWILLEESRFQEALKYFSSAVTLPCLETGNIWQIDITPLSRYHLPLSKICYGRGKAYLGLQEPKLALPELTQALVLEPGLEEALRSRLEIHMSLGDIPGILQDSTTLLQSSPEGHRYRLERAKALFHSEKYAEAEKDLLILSAQKYEKKAVLKMRIQTYVRMPNPGKALADLVEYLKLEPQERESWIMCGQLYETAEKWEQAAYNYEKAARLSPDKEVYQKLVAIYSRLKKSDGPKEYRKLLGAYQKFLTFEPHNLEILYQRSHVYLEMQRYKEALADLNNILSKRENHEDAYVNRGLCYYQLGERHKALADFSKAIALNTARPEAYYLRGNLLEQSGEWKQAGQDFTQFLLLRPNETNALLARARCHMKLNAYETALGDLDKIVLLEPRNVKLLELRGESYMNLQKYKEAIMNFETASQYGDLSAQGFNYRGYCYSCLNEPDKAISDYRRAIQKDKNFAMAYLNLGISLYYKNLPGEAITEISKAIVLDPQNVQGYTNRGQIYLRQKEYEKAIDDMSEAIRIQPSAMAYYHRGCSWYFLKKYREAEEDFQKIPHYDEDSRWINLVKKFLTKHRSK